MKRNPPRGGAHRVGRRAAGGHRRTVLVGFAVAKRQQLAAQEAATREAKLRGLAEQNLKLAEEAVDGYLTRVAEDERLKQGDFNKLRTELLETGTCPSTSVSRKQKPGDAQSEANQANAYARLASIPRRNRPAPAFRDGIRASYRIAKSIGREVPEQAGISRASCRPPCRVGLGIST